MLKDHSEAEDITQDIFLKIWRNRTSIGAVDAFGPYLFRMARNAVYDRFDNRSVREITPAGPACCPNTSFLTAPSTAATCCC